jgi:hypothetical protein
MALRLLQTTSFIWAGGLLAIALEAQVKFNAPTVTKEIGLDVGRHVFGAVNKAELGLWVALLGTLFASAPVPDLWWAVAGVSTILALQTAWVLPILQRQAKAIIEGKAVPDADYAHVGYIFLEVAKITGLFFIGWNAVPS